MISVSNAIHPIVEEETTVRIKIPEVDRSKADACSILAIVLSQRSHDGLYKLDTKSGIFKQLYARSQFSVCQERLMAKDDVPDVEISLRQTATKQSISHGQEM
ncbi:unnamed protein product [Euphydryas editha]|uniref:Uncharacterized protein n=1 Tax=Euphydryas editha TaxID=104508 RepID=A0AAU9TTE7_EUPED|nr:unnamed protein product [Euphydryas editha]